MSMEDILLVIATEKLMKCGLIRVRSQPEQKDQLAVQVKAFGVWVTLTTLEHAEIKRRMSI